MNADELREFVRSNHHAVLATRRRDGGVQQSPVAVGVDERDGALLISTRETAIKTANLRRDPRASVCVFTPRFFGQWGVAEGPVTIVSLPEAMEGLVDYYRGVVGEHPDWEDYRAAMVRERRVLLRLHIERAGPTQQG